MTSRLTLTITEDELKLRAEYYLNQVELQGLTLLIERDGIIAAKIQPPEASGVASESAPDWLPHVGVLSQSPNFSGDPVAIQRKTRAE